jgi:hypothetical protein
MVWTPDELPLRGDRIYTEEDTKAMARYIRDEEDKRILAEILEKFGKPITQSGLR